VIIRVSCNHEYICQCLTKCHKTYENGSIICVMLRLRFAHSCIRIFQSIICEKLIILYNVIDIRYSTTENIIC